MKSYGGGGWGGRGRRHLPPDEKPSLSRVLSHFRPFIAKYRLAMGLGTACLVTALLLRKANPLIVRLLVDDVFTPMMKDSRTDALVARSHQLLWGCIAAMVAISAVSALITRLHMRVMRRAGASMVQEIRLHVYQHLQKLSLRFYESRQTGDIMSRVTGDVGSMERLITQIGDRLLTDCLNIVATMGILLVLNWKLALVALAPVPILIITIRWFGKTVRPVYRKVRDHMGGIHAKLQDNISGIRVIKAFNTEEAEAEGFAEENREFFDVQMKEVRLSSNVFPFIRFIDGLGVILVTACGGYMLLQPSPELTIGDLFAFNAFVLQLYQPIGSMFHMYNVVLQALASGERVADVLECEPDVMDLPDAENLPAVTGLVEFDAVNFHYVDDAPVLKDVSFTAAPGEVVALVGPSGTGKTSIINLVLRFYDPVSGGVRIDGHDLRHVTQASLRSQIAVVLQDPFLFNGTVLENIRYACPDADMDQVRRAAEAAHAAEFIDELPKEYDTEIGERGVKLSGGQKQRLAIARALLADRKVLILDEATSMVDSHGEYLIKKALDELMRDRTTFVIAHRLSTVKHADKILVLNDGRIVESGHHDALIAQGGAYAEMYGAQFRLDRETLITDEDTTDT